MIETTNKSICDDRNQFGIIRPVQIMKLGSSITCPYTRKLDSYFFTLKFSIKIKFSSQNFPECLYGPRSGLGMNRIFGIDIISYNVAEYSVRLNVKLYGLPNIRFAENRNMPNRILKNSF